MPGSTIVRRLLLGTGLMVVMTSASSAQRMNLPPEGSKLRVWTPLVGGSGRVQGWLRSSDSASVILTMADSSGMRLLWTQVDSVQMSRYTSGRAGPAALKGALIVGSILGALAGAGTGEGEVIDAGAAAGVGFVFGAMVGGLVGAVIGKAGGTEVWEPVSRWDRATARPPTG